MVRHQRVDVEFADFGVLGGELPQADQHIGDRVDRRRRPLAIALQQPPYPGAGH
jgi:hypothetical protein